MYSLPHHPKKTWILSYRIINSSLYRILASSSSQHSSHVAETPRTLPGTENLWMCVFYSMWNCQVCTGQRPRLFWEWFWTIFDFLAGCAFLTVLGQMHKRLVIRKGSKRVHLCFPFSEPGLWLRMYGQRGSPLLWVWQWERIIPWA